MKCLPAEGLGRRGHGWLWREHVETILQTAEGAAGRGRRTQGDGNQAARTETAKSREASDAGGQRWTGTSWVGMGGGINARWPTWMGMQQGEGESGRGKVRAEGSP